MSTTNDRTIASYSIPIVITIAVSFLAIVGLVAVLILTGHDPSSFLSAIIVVVGLLPSIGVIGIAAANTAKKTDTVISNTNGNLTKLQTQNQALTSVATPEQIIAANSALPTEIHLPLKAEAPVEPVQQVPTVSPVAAVPTPAQIDAAVQAVTPVTPINVTSGGNV